MKSSKMSCKCCDSCSNKDEVSCSEKLDTDWDIEWKEEFKFNINYYQPGGLYNVGNTCYINSIIQSLAHLPLFCQYLDCQKIYHTNNCKKDKNFQFCLTCHLIYLVPHIIVEDQNKDELYQLLDELAQKMSKIIPTFEIECQQDASEYLIAVLQILKQEFIPIKKNDKNIIDKLFGSSMITTTFCCECETKKDTEENFYVLQTNINNKEINNLNDSINYLKESEILSEENKYFCNECNKKVDDAIKSVELNKLSDHFIITLNRFIYDKKERKFLKNNKDIPFKELININNHIYRLNSIIIHYGGINAGHYYTYCRGINSQWFQINDEKVIQVNKKFVMSQKKPYMLFYRKICILPQENEID